MGSFPPVYSISLGNMGLTKARYNAANKGGSWRERENKPATFFIRKDENPFLGKTCRIH